MTKGEGGVYGRLETEWHELVQEAVDFLSAQAGLARMTTYTGLYTVLAQRTGQPPFDFSQDSGRAAVGALLGSVVDRTLSDSGAMLSSIVIYLNANDAGPGFYKLAAQLGLLEPRASTVQNEAFWTSQVKQVHAHYAPSDFDHRST